MNSSELHACLKHLHDVPHLEITLDSGGSGFSGQSQRGDGARHPTRLDGGYEFRGSGAFVARLMDFTLPRFSKLIHGADDIASAGQ